MSTLRNSLSELASKFAAGVLSAIRTASLEDILDQRNQGSGVARRGPGRPKGSGAASAPRAVAVSEDGGKRRGRKGRLERRSADDIGALVDKIVSLLSANPKGLRAEEIRTKLGLEAKELPRPIADALAAKKITKVGQKRATTYFAGSAKAAKADKGEKKGKGAKGKRGRKAKGAASVEAASA